MLSSRVVRLLVAAGCASAAAHAAPLAVVNPGFEDISGESPFNEFTFGPLNGWDLHDPGAITSGGAGPTYYIGTLTPFEPDPVGNPGVYANFPGGAAEGSRVAIAFNFTGSGGQGEYGFVQHLGATLQASTAYTLEVEIGNIASAFATSGEFFDLDGFPGYRVDLLAGGVVLASDNNTLAGAIPEGQWATSTVQFTTGAAHAQLGQTLSIRLVNLNVVDPVDPGANLEVDFDDVRLDASAVTPPDCPGDADGDGDVDFDDLNEVLAGWGTSGPAGDVNGSGFVDFDDLNDVLGAWNVVCF